MRAGTGAAPSIPARAALIALEALAVLALFASCEPRSGKITLDADDRHLPRLERILLDSPLPRGWEIVPSVGAESGYRISLETGPFIARDEPRRTAHGEGRARIGSDWMAVALPLSSARFSLRDAEARGLGLRPLDSIEPPFRLPLVDGRWPGDEGYPYEMDLFLTVRANGASQTRKSAIPRPLSGWLAETAGKIANEAPFSLAAVGDIEIGPRDGRFLSGGESGLERLLGGGLLPFLRARDILVGNLEGPISAGGFPNPRKRFLFRFPPGASRALRDAGFDLLLFANNHAFDFGALAFEDSLVDLEAGEMPHAGAGRNASLASAPTTIRVGGSGAGLSFVGFAFYPDEITGFTLEEAAAGSDKPGINADEAATIDAIRIARASGSTVVVLAHGGAEYMSSPSELARKTYRGFVDAGAALVIGSHPHVLQGIEARSGSLIAYSLGNFLFTGEREPEASMASAVISFLMYRGKARGIRIDALRSGFEGSALETQANPDMEAKFARLCSELE